MVWEGTEVLYRNQSIENLICKYTKQVSRQGSSTLQLENGSRKGTQFVVGRGLEQPGSNIRGVKITPKRIEAILLAIPVRF